jgi:hypothetical protein
MCGASLLIGGCKKGFMSKIPLPLKILLIELVEGASIILEADITRVPSMTAEIRKGRVFGGNSDEFTYSI